MGAAHRMPVKNGIKLPEEMKLVGFDDVLLSEIMGLTTVRQPMAQMGKLAAIRIIDMIEGRPIEIQRQRLPVELIKRDTV